MAISKVIEFLGGMLGFIGIKIFCQGLKSGKRIRTQSLLNNGLNLAPKERA
jgi:hypothetical protein